jgi:type IV pilus assembly protein PilN
LNINLASKPYVDVQRILLYWGSAVLALAVFTVALAWTAVASWRESSDVNAKISQLHREIASLDKQRAEAVAILKRPENSSVVETSRFLNGLIARKSFSWTKVFMQLEEIMPPKLHVISITPELQPRTNTVQVNMNVAGTSREAAVELVKRLEQSPNFKEARIAEESQIKDRQSADTVEFKLTAIYVPRAVAPVQPPAAAQPASIATNPGGAR